MPSVRSPVTRARRTSVAGRVGEWLVAQHDRTEPGHPARDDVAVGPEHLVHCGQQCRRGPFGQLLVGPCREPDPALGAAGPAVRVGDREPLRVGRGVLLDRRAAGHQVHAGTGGPPPGQPLRIRQRHHQRRVRPRPWPAGRRPARTAGSTSLRQRRPPSPWSSERSRRNASSTSVADGERAVVQQRHHLGGGPGAHRRSAVQQGSGQSRMQPDAGDPPAPLGDPAGPVQRAQRRQHLPTGGQRTRWRAVPPDEALAVRCAPAGQFKCQPGQVGGPDLRFRETGAASPAPAPANTGTPARAPADRHVRRAARRPPPRPWS